MHEPHIEKTWLCQIRKCLATDTDAIIPSGQSNAPADAHSINIISFNNDKGSSAQPNQQILSQLIRIVLRLTLGFVNLRK